MSDEGKTAPDGSRVEHRVAQGETLTGIAIRYGFRDPNVIWQSPDNAALKEKRQNPHVLQPGDTLVIPARKPRTVPAPTDKRHVLIVKAPALKLRLRLLDPFEQPLASKPFTAKMGDRIEKGTTDGDGNLSFDVKASDQKAEVTVGTATYVLAIGSLDPEKSVAGVAARLHNLGYGSSFEALEPGSDAMKFALSLFMDERKLDTESCSREDICAILEKAHGS